MQEDIEVWNRTAQLIDYRELGLYTKLIEAHRFQKDHWISRPAWFWDKLREDESIQEVIEPWRLPKSIGYFAKMLPVSTIKKIVKNSLLIPFRHLPEGLLNTSRK